MPASRNITSVKKEQIQEYGEDLSIVIPAAGIGRRMKSHGPKSLIYVKDCSIIERQIRLVQKYYPKSEIIVVVGFKSDLMREQIRKKYPVKLIYNFQYEENNVCRSIGIGLQACNRKHVLIIYGDLVFNYKTIKGLHDGVSKLLFDSKGFLNDNEVGMLVSEDKTVTNLSFGLKDKWCQIAYLHGRELKELENITIQDECEKWFGYEAINKVIENGGRFVGVEPNGMRIFEIDSPKDLQCLNMNIKLI
tara:strand:+ start:532 stop:1275 length:744 start_codon:yes stop_codon:yes gene_type:complete